jgi:predicted Zn finger-like uncharacterized protein
MTIQVSGFLVKIWYKKESTLCKGAFMIITCPHCSARYKVKDDLIKAKGKRVKCKKCTAIFVAYPDRDAVLEKKPDEAATQKMLPDEKKVEPVAAPVPPAAPAQAVPQATVKVDRSKLDQFLQSNQESATAANSAPSLDSTQSTVQVDPDQFQKYMAEQKNLSAQATVQVDRSQINEFLKETNSPPPREPSTQATQKMDAAALAALSKQQARPEHGPPSGSTIQVDPESLAALTQQGPPPPPHVPSVEDANDAAPAFDDDMPTAPPDFGDSPAFGDDDEIIPPPVTSREPHFPSDEELGLDGETPGFGGEPSAFDDIPTPPSEAQAEPAPPVRSQPNTGNTYDAMVENQKYPNLSLDDIHRWIREGRLIEEDNIAVHGTQNYNPADQYPEIASVFEEYGGSQPVSKPEKKKGFFSRLFGK